MPPVLRDPVPRRRLLVAGGLILLAGWAALSLLTHLRRRPHPEVPIGSDDPTFDRIYLRDVVQSYYEGGEKRWSLSAAEIIHRKRKIGPLTVNPVKEVEMTGVSIELNHPGTGGPGLRAADDDLDLPVRSILEATLAAKNLGFVSRVLVARLDLAVLRDGKPVFRITAGRASIGLDPDQVRFSGGVTVTGRTGERLDADEAEWRSPGRRLFVEGEFRFEDARGPHQGRKAAFRIDPDGALTRE